MPICPFKDALTSVDKKALSTCPDDVDAWSLEGELHTKLAVNPPPASAPAEPQSDGKDATLDTDSSAAKALALVAKEVGMAMADLQDEATFANLGVGSLMSLVVAEEFREELEVTVTGSLFLEYPTARRSLLTNVAKIQVLLGDLTDFLQQIAVQLSRVLRLMATAGFPQEPQPGQIMHTYLSNLFVSQQRFRDATAFLAECCVPSVLRMASMTDHQGGQQQANPDETSYNLAFVVRLPALHGDFEDSITESGAQSTKRARVPSGLYPSLRFIVQIAGRDPSDYDAGRTLAPRPPSSPDTLQAQANHPRISVQTRSLGPGQPALDVAAYILHLPSVFPAHEAALRASIAKDLQAYTGFLAANRGAMLIVTARLLPPPDAVDRDLKAIARVRDLTLL
ncbi:hypothetical protein ATEIFO6365_0005075700 [Aspergillus terreus]|uniref:Uncharacterized protein n=1 Tax=Aspergillus terreus TaxID=33178 RepID=A0A5M3Z398_ASPTE|nr:hypothetical protein ATETN484_0007059800 [Aspergillus terreus]GFF16565.1 hypothetical protein ATEIFO6365_0005075700 [Aspergillus terreus]